MTVATINAAGLSARQDAILRHMGARLEQGHPGGFTRANSWGAVPQPDAPQSEWEMSGSLERMTARGILTFKGHNPDKRVYRLAAEALELPAVLEGRRSVNPQL